MTREQMQEEEYSFPYHHLPELQPFSQAKVLFWGYEYAAYIAEVLTKIESFSFSSFIDVGCGDGKLLYELQKRNPQKRFTGTDFDARALAFAHAFSPTIRFQKDIPEESFDAFALIEVIEHIPPEEISSFLAMLSTHLSPGDRGIITTPSTNIPVVAKHYQHFSEATLRSYLEPHFIVESVEYLNVASFGTKLLQRIFSNQFFILNHRPLLNFFYGLYQKKYLHASTTNGSRLMAVVRAKK